MFQVELRQTTKFMERFSNTHLWTYLNQLRNALGNVQAANRFRQNVSTTHAAKAIFGAIDEMATSWILSSQRYALVNQADIVIDLFVNGIIKK